MDRKLSNEVDGFVVDEYAGTFTGTFEVRGADARYLAYDDEVLVVVRARVKMPRLKEMKNGDIVRVNVLSIKEAGVVRSDPLKEQLCETLGLDVPDAQLTFDEVLAIKEGESPSSADPEPIPEPELIKVDMTVPPIDVDDVELMEERVTSTKDKRLAAFLMSDS